MYYAARAVRPFFWKIACHNEVSGSEWAQTEFAGDDQWPMNRLIATSNAVNTDESIRQLRNDEWLIGHLSDTLFCRIYGQSYNMA